MTPSIKRIVLELDEGAVPITGRICAPGAAPLPFIGWTALISALMSTTSPASKESQQS